MATLYDNTWRALTRIEDRVHHRKNTIAPPSVWWQTCCSAYKAPCRSTLREVSHAAAR